MTLETTGGIRKERIKSITFTKKEYNFRIEGTEILEFIAVLKMFLRGKLKQIKEYKTMFFDKNEIKLQAGDIIFSMYDVELLNEIFHELRKTYEIVDLKY